MAGKGISGLAVTATAAGGLLVYAGIRDVPVLDGLRSILRGQVPEGRPPVQAPGLDFGGPGGDFGGGDFGAPTTAQGAGIVAEARKYLGTPYKWGGSEPGGFDCSGYASYVLRKRGLLDRRLTSAGFLVWSGATTIPRSQIAPGDLVCYGGHIGIAVSATQMIHAPHAGSTVRIGNIYGSPRIRRVKGSSVDPFSGMRHE